MGTTALVAAYLSVGIVIGLVEFAIAEYAFRNHPDRGAISHQEVFITCVVKNALAWPVILFWLGLLGLLKVFVVFRRMDRPK